MSDLFSAILTSMDKVVFTRSDDGLFNLRSAPPDWFLHLTDAATVEVYDLVNDFPFLACFIPDAEARWDNRNTEVLRSGSWVETNHYGQEVPLEAVAFFAGGYPVLVLEYLGEKYFKEVAMLQHIRDGLLTREMLESEVRCRTRQIRQREEEIALKLVSLTSYRDEETGEHVRRIGLYAAAIARELGWSDADINDIRIAAPMHDIGKIGIPDRILLKAGALNDSEFTVMKRHTLIGAQMLEGTGIPVLEMAADIARHHHERWDGSGYPAGLKGEDIPVAARITAIVDIYDALVHERVYKEAMPEEEALSIMRDIAGKHLDPNLIKTFLRLLPVMRQIREDVAEDSVQPPVAKKLSQAAY